MLVTLAIGAAIGIGNYALRSLDAQLCLAGTCSSMAAISLFVVFALLLCALVAGLIIRKELVHALRHRLRLVRAGEGADDDAWRLVVELREHLLVRRLDRFARVGRDRAAHTHLGIDPRAKGRLDLLRGRFAPRGGGRVDGGQQLLHRRAALRLVERDDLAREDPLVKAEILVELPFPSVTIGVVNGHNRDSLVRREQVLLATAAPDFARVRRSYMATDEFYSSPDKLYLSP